MDELTVGGRQIRPGERVTIDLNVARLYTHAEMPMPVHVVRGKRPGPRAFVCAAIHGDEINGVEIIRRLLKLKVLNKIRGTLFLIPVVNVFGFINQNRYLPDRRDLNRFFPGSEGGSLAARLAHLFMEEIVSNSEFGIDLHTGSNQRTNLPQIRIDFGQTDCERLARAFGAPVIIDSKLRKGSLREAAAAKGVPVLLYEAGEVFRFNENAIRVGVKGVLGVLRKEGMLPGLKKTATARPAITCEATTWVRASMSGILNRVVPLGTVVEKDSKLGTISDPLGETEIDVRSPLPGVVIGLVQLPLVHKGDALFHIASTEQCDVLDQGLDFFETPTHDL